MPLLQLELIEEIFTSVQKKEIMCKLADTRSINGENIRSAAWFSMDELCNGEWRFGGNKTE